MILTAALLAAGSAPAATLTLRDAAAEALAGNPAVTAAAAESRASHARLAGARAAWLPAVEASAASVRSNNPVFVFGSLLEQGRFSGEHFAPSFLNDPPALRNDRLTLGVRWALFDQMGRRDAEAIARTGVGAAAAVESETRQSILAEVVVRYFGVAAADERQTAAAAAVKAAEAAARAARDKTELGLIVESDRLAADVQLADFRRQEIEAEGDRAIARAALATVLGRSPLSDLEIDGTMPAKPVLPLTRAEVTAAALRRGQLAAAALSTRAAELQLRTARGALLPRVDTYANWGASGTTLRERNGDHTIGIVASISLFDGGRYARIAESNAELARTRANEQAVRDAMQLESITAWVRLDAARQEVSVASAAAAQAEAAARIVADRYENGLTTITERLRADAALLAARLALLTARHHVIVGYAELLRSMGELHDVEPFL